MSVVENLEPKLLWKYFDEIRKIPRCSKHEEKIRKYIIDFAEKLELKIKFFFIFLLASFNVCDYLPPRYI